MAGVGKIWFVTQKSGIGRLTFARDDNEYERPEHVRIGRGVRSSGDDLIGGARQSFLEVQFKRMLSACSKQRVGQYLRSVGRQERRGEPDRLKAVENVSGFSQVAGPEDIVCRGTCAIIRENGLWEMGTKKIGIPEMSSGNGDHLRF